MTKPHIDPDLAVGLNFDADDLAANRAGEMTKNQVKQLALMQEPLVVTAIVFSLTGGAFIIVASFILVSSLTPSVSRTPVELICAMLGMIALGGWFIYIGTQPTTTIPGDQANRRVEQLSGKVFLHSNGGLYNIVIDDVWLKISRDAFIRFKSHEYYTVYYTPNSKIVLSAEPYEP
jgi:hypothetical protein